MNKSIQTEQPEPQTIKKAKVMSESTKMDLWLVEEKDPNLHYVFARKDSDEELSRLSLLGYEPAKGKERIVTNPFSPKNVDGKIKVRGGRILLCCPKELVAARRAERASRRVDAKQAARNDAGKMMAEGVPGSVIPQAEVTIKRESRMELAQ